jgi:hypothetical protein
MTAWRSSRFLPEIRSWSPWAWDWTFFRPSPLMNLLSSLALSWEMPAFSVATWRAVAPDASSTVPYATAFRLTLRRTSFSSSTSRSAFSRSSVEECRRISMSPSSTLELVFLKS